MITNGRADRYVFKHFYAFSIVRELLAGWPIAAIIAWIGALKKLSNKNLGLLTTRLIALSSIGISMVTLFDPTLIKKVL